jgi:hypothetical protein
LASQLRKRKGSVQLAPVVATFYCESGETVLFENVASVVRRLPPAVRFGISVVGLGCGFAIEFIHSDPPSISHALLLLLCVLVAMAGLVVFLVEWRGRTKPPAQPVSPPGTIASPERPPWSRIERIARVPGLMVLGGIATLGVWGEWVGGVGGLAYASWRTWQVVQAGKTPASALPHLFVALVGGSFIFEGIGFVVAAVMRGVGH